MLQATANPTATFRSSAPSNPVLPPALHLASPPATQPSRAVGRFARSSDQPDAVAAVLTVTALLADLPAYSPVDMGGWLEKLCHGLDASYGRPGGPSISCSATACKLPMGQAITLGLIADLLVSDAYVHGFSPSEGGRIAVSMIGLESLFELTIDDSGRDAAHARAEASTHARRLARQLGGWFETPEVVGGRRYVITVPRHTMRQSS